MARPTKYEKWKKDNPNGTPYEALNAQVITAAEYETAMKAENDLATAPKQSAPIEVTPVAQVEPDPIPVKPVINPAAKPIVKEINSAVLGGQVFLKNKKTGKHTRMTAEAAKRMVRKMPSVYEIK